MGVTLPDDTDDAWLRELTLPEEFIIRNYPSARGAYNRWFSSPNVVDLVRVRRERKKVDPTIKK